MTSRKIQKKCFNDEGAFKYSEKQKSAKIYEVGQAE